ncbi:hypothetical protein WJ972_06820 [Achromobacter insuavis]
MIAFLRASKTGVPVQLALGFLTVVVLAAVFGPALGLADPYRIDAANLLSSPSWQHWLGTDELGRDLLARAVYGARVSLSVAAAAVILAGVLGVAVGVGVAFLGRRAEAAAIRVVDVFVSLPEIFVALVVLAFIGGNLPTLVGTIGVLYAPQFARSPGAWRAASGRASTCWPPVRSARAPAGSSGTRCCPTCAPSSRCRPRSPFPSRCCWRPA